MARGGVDDDQRVPRLERDHGAGRVGRGVAEGARRIHQHRPRLDVDRALADPLVGLARLAPPKPDRGLQLVLIVEAERELVPERAEVEAIDEGVDPVEELALQGPALEGLVRGAGLRGVQAERLVEGARVGRTRHLGAPALPIPVLELTAGALDLRRQGLVLLAHRDPVELEHPEADAAAKLGGDLEVDRHRQRPTRARPISSMAAAASRPGTVWLLTTIEKASRSPAGVVA